MSSDIIYYGVHYCRCCCERDMPFTNARCNGDAWRCGGCNCTSRLPDDASLATAEARVTVRVYHTGQQTLTSMKAFTSIAEILGAAGDSPYTTESISKTVYVEVPTSGIEARMELLNSKR